MRLCGLTRHSAPSRQRGKLRDVHAWHLCAVRLQGSESKLGARYTPTTLSTLNESVDGDSSGSSMMVMTRQSEDLFEDFSTPPAQINKLRSQCLICWFIVQFFKYLFYRLNCWGSAPPPPHLLLLAGRGLGTTAQPGCVGRPPVAKPPPRKRDERQTSTERWGWTGLISWGSS